MEGKIYQAISNVMADIGAVGKNNTNQFDKYKFRGIDDVMNALYPAMVKNHVFVTPEVLESQREERASKDGKTMMYTILKIKYTFYTDDGSSVECTVVGEAMDRSDKSTNKAMSAGFKYACFQTFCIPTEELIDSEIESPEIGSKTTKKEQPKKPQTKAETPKNNLPVPQKVKQEEPSQEVKEMLTDEAIANVDKNLIPTGGLVTEEQLKMINSELERTGIKVNVILNMFKVQTLEEMTNAQAIACLNKFAKTPTKGE